MEYKFFNKIDDCVKTNWKKIRKDKFNELVDLYNDWQIHNNFDSGTAKMLLALIEYCLQTFPSDEKDEYYGVVLDDMKEFILSKCNPTKNDIIAKYGYSEHEMFLAFTEGYRCYSVYGVTDDKLVNKYFKPFMYTLNKG